MTDEPVSAVLEALEGGEAGLETPPVKRYCFVEGTYVATLRGEMPVDLIRPGDHIRAKKGSFHVVSDVAVFAYADLPPEAQAKVGLYQVRRGAIEEGLPKRDLYVSEGQQFELSRRLEIAHAVRMATRKAGAALDGFRFVVFTCDGLPMIRAEGVWTTLTPIERAFPVPQPEAAGDDDAGETAEAQPPEGETTARVEEIAPRPVSRALSIPGSTRRATRRPQTRLLLRPVSEPASHHTETGTPAP